MELAELFKQVNELVVVQEVKTQQISTDAENVMTNVDQGNKELTVAVKKARAARRKKWICLGICRRSSFPEQRQDIANQSFQSVLLPLSSLLSSHILVQLTNWAIRVISGASSANTPWLIWV